jgi:type IV fimbrial biogenesis protein FimT
MSGLGLVEVVISLAVVLVVLGVALPSFGSWVRDMPVRAAAESLKSGFELARMEAVRRNARIRFKIGSDDKLLWKFGCDSGDCPALLQSAPASETSGATLVATASPPATPAPGAVLFNGLGQVEIPAGASSIDRIEVTAQGSSRRLVLRVSLAGTIILCDPAESGAACQ